MDFESIFNQLKLSRRGFDLTLAKQSHRKIKQGFFETKKYSGEQERFPLKSPLFLLGETIRMLTQVNHCKTETIKTPLAAHRS